MYCLWTIPTTFAEPWLEHMRPKPKKEGQVSDHEAVNAQKGIAIALSTVTPPRQSSCYSQRSTYVATLGQLT